MRAKKFQFPPKQNAIQKTQSAGHVADKHGDEQMSIDSMFKTAGSMTIKPYYQSDRRRDCFVFPHQNEVHNAS